MAEICKGIPEFPRWAGSSEAYREIFNTVAEELGLKIRYVADNGLLPNVPEIALGEVEVDQPAWKKYNIDSAKPAAFNMLIYKDVCKVRQEIHKRVSRVNKEGINLFPVLKSPTYKHNKLALLNPAEQAWVGAVKDVLFEASQSIYSLQSIPNAMKTLKWVRENGDPYSVYHFEKNRDGNVYAKEVKGFKNSSKYASSVPWFPEKPAYSMMWPMDFTEEELKYINEHYGELDPVKMPYTVVKRLSKEDKEKIVKNAKEEFIGGKPVGWIVKEVEGRPVEWIREGVDGKFYHVVNMAFEGEMRPHFLKMAEVLEKNADTNVGDSALHPQFREYTLKMAKCFRTGDFDGLLRADMDQFEGPLFLSVFPHEGYWADGVKYPVIFGLGIKEEASLKEIEKQAYAFNWLSEKVTKAAREAGLKGYQAPAFDAVNIRKSAAFIWPIILGGFLRAYKRDAGGHDYPRRKYEGIKEGEHRVVIVLDTSETWFPLTKKVAEDIFAGGVEKYITFDGIVKTALGHEVTHGIQIRQTDTVLNGKKLGEAFGMWWGLLVEPWADAGDMLFHHKLFKDGNMTEKEYKKVLYGQIVYNVNRMDYREEALSDGMIAEVPHIPGSNMLIGRIYKDGALNYKSGRLFLDDEKAIAVLDKFFDELSTYAAKGDMEAFKTFVKDCVYALPEDIEKEILGKKGPSYTILERDGDLKLPKGFKIK